MSTVIQPFIDRIDDISRNLELVAIDILKEHKDEILSIVQDLQLGKGTDSFGKLLVHPSKKNNPSGYGVYSEATDNYWSKLYPPNTSKNAGDLYSFNWTGSTFDGMDIIKTTKKTFTIFSRDTKAKELERIYGTKLFDLTEEHNEWINLNLLLPKLQEYSLNEMFKGLI
jgi:hypothetical protein